MNIDERARRSSRPALVLEVCLALSCVGCWKDSVVGVSEASPPGRQDAGSPPDASDAEPDGSSVEQAPITQLVGVAGEWLGLGSIVLGDIDGDGYDDFLLSAVGVSEIDQTVGETTTTYLFYGRPKFPAQLATGDAEARLSGQMLGAQPLGDINGDGLADFTLEMRELEVHIVLGSAKRLRGAMDPTSAASVRWVAPAGTASGGGPGVAGLWARSAGDVNGDGLADLLVSVPRPFDSIGPFSAVSIEPQIDHLVLGHRGEWPSGAFDPSWASATFAPASPLPIERAGDLDGDGSGDLFAPGDSANELFYGGPGRLSGELMPALADARLTHPVFQMALGDVDADGVGDLAFVQWGQVDVAYGQNERWSSDVTLEPDLSLTFENAGGPTTALAIGDIDADGAPDIVVGDATYGSEASGTETGVGALYVIRGSGQRLLGTRAVTDADIVAYGQFLQPDPTRTGSPGAAALGSSIALGDINGDGSDDILVTAAGTDPRATSGAVLFIPSGPGTPL